MLPSPGCGDLGVLAELEASPSLVILCTFSRLRVCVFTTAAGGGEWHSREREKDWDAGSLDDLLFLFTLIRVCIFLGVAANTFGSPRIASRVVDALNRGASHLR